MEQELSFLFLLLSYEREIFISMIAPCICWGSIILSTLPLLISAKCQWNENAKKKNFIETTTAVADATGCSDSTSGGGHAADAAHAELLSLWKNPGH